MPAQPGQTLSHYRLVEKIGEGGMGVVWKAEDTVLGRTVAIKVLPADVARDENRRKMFFDEARLASSLSEAYIVQVYEFGREGDLDFIVMEYLEGKPLNRVLHGRPLPPDKVADLGYQVARALSKAHRKGLLHRDLKPSNILVTPDGDAKVVDFGLATLFPPRDSTAGTEELTQPLREGPGERQRGIMGTLPYMSPEQVRGEKLDARSDIFSLGTVLYEMTTGQRPFRGAGNQEVAAEILKTRPKPVHEVVPKVPLDLDKIISKSLAPRRADRYQTTDDLAVDLKRLGRDLESGSSPSYEELGKSVEKRGRWVGVGALASVLTVAGFVWLIGSRFVPGVDPHTILILPMEIRGQKEGAEYVGRAFAEAIVANLVQAKDLNVLAVPDVGEMGGSGSLGRARSARDLGAGRLITGSVTREGEAVNASLSLVDTTKNNVIWATQENVGDGDLSRLASALAQEVASELGTSLGRYYDSPYNLTGGPEMAASPDTTRALGAIRRNEVSAALEATQRLLESFPDEPDAHVLRATALLNHWIDDPSSANRRALEDRLIILERVDPGNPYPQVYRAWSSAPLGEAIERLTQVLGREDLTPAARRGVLTTRAWRKRNFGDAAGALEDLEEALRLDPASASTLSSLGVILLEEKRFEEAVGRTRQAVALEPSNWKYHLYLGRALDGAEEWEDAAGAFARACELNRSQRSCAYLSIALFKAGKETEARTAAARASGLPDTLDGTYNLACYWTLAGKRAEALGYLGRSRDLGLRTAWLVRDPDLISLHGDPEFEAIVAEVERRMQSKAEPGQTK